MECASRRPLTPSAWPGSGGDPSFSTEGLCTVGFLWLMPMPRLAVPEGAGDPALGRLTVILRKSLSRQTALARCESLKDGHPWTPFPVARAPTFNCWGDCRPRLTARRRKVTEPSGLPLRLWYQTRWLPRSPPVRQPGSADPLCCAVCWVLRHRAAVRTRNRTDGLRLDPGPVPGWFSSARSGWQSSSKSPI